MVKRLSPRFALVWSALFPFFRFECQLSSAFRLGLLSNEPHDLVWINFENMTILRYDRPDAPA